jgi:DNA-binding MarR family transcriptional regulator
MVPGTSADGVEGGTAAPADSAALAPARRRWSQLSADQRDAWLGLLRVHARVTKRLDAELQAEHALPLSSFDVLVQLAFAPGGQLRMSDLAEAVVLSASGLTRLVDRLAAQGLLERRRCTADTRVVYAHITEAGLALLAEAMPTHIDGVRRIVLDRLTREQTEGVAVAMRALLGGTVR